MPWHYTTIVDLIDHWQTLLAGLIALIAAAITVLVTLKVERRKVDREIDALRKSLAIELRQLIPGALGAYTSLHRLGSKADGPITARMVESLSRVPGPLVYPANIHKIALIGSDAMDVVIVYGLLEIARDGVGRLMTYRTPDDISPIVILTTAETFLEVCKYARSVLPKLRTGVALHDDQDTELLQKINEATSVQHLRDQHSSASKMQSPVERSRGMDEAENKVKADVHVAKEAIYQRGLFLSRYAAVEFAIAELVSRACLHPAYSRLGHPPFGPAKKLRRLNQLIALDGPIASYRNNLQPMLDTFSEYEEHRNFMVHAIMVPASTDNISFKMYDHREGLYSVGELQFELEHLETLATSISSISIPFPTLIAKICGEIPLPEA